MVNNSSGVEICADINKVELRRLGRPASATSGSVNSSRAVTRQHLRERNGRKRPSSNSTSPSGSSPPSKVAQAVFG